MRQGVHDFKMFTSKKTDALQSAMQLPCCSSCVSLRCQPASRNYQAALLSPTCEFCREGTLLGKGLKDSLVFQAGGTQQKQSKGDLLQCDFHPQKQK